MNSPIRRSPGKFPEANRSFASTSALAFDLDENETTWKDVSLRALYVCHGSAAMPSIVQSPAVTSEVPYVRSRRRPDAAR